MSSIICLERALDMLNLLYENGGKMGVSDIARSMGLHKSTVYRTLDALYLKDFLFKDKQSGKYSLGPRVFQLGFIAASNLPLVRIAKPHMAYLSEKYEEHVSISILEGPTMFAMNYYLGSTSTTLLSSLQDCDSSDAYRPAVGKIFMSSQPNALSVETPIIVDNYNRLLKKRPRFDATATLEALVEELKQVRERGYAYEDGELLVGQVCYAVPIMNQDEVSFAALAMFGAKQRLARFSTDEIVRDMLYTGRIITEHWNNDSFGGEAPPKADV